MAITQPETVWQLQASCGSVLIVSVAKATKTHETKIKITITLTYIRATNRGLLCFTVLCHPSTVTALESPSFIYTVFTQTLQQTDFINFWLSFSDTDEVCTDIIFHLPHQDLYGLVIHLSTRADKPYETYINGTQKLSHFSSLPSLVPSGVC